MSGRVVTTEAELAPLVRSLHHIAVLGIKDARDGDQPAYAIPKTLLELGKHVVGVNPIHPEALGQKNLRTLAELPAGIDALVVFRRIDAIPGIAAELLALPEPQRPRVVWLQTGIHHDDAAARLAEAGYVVVQDRCLGVYAHRYR